MPAFYRPALSNGETRRTHLLGSALRLSEFSVAWGLLSGSVAVAAGLSDASLGVLGLGLNVLADVIGSGVLVWRFRAELHHDAHAPHVEARAVRVVAAALATVSLILAVGAVQALAAGTHPRHSALSLITAGLAVLVLTPLAYAKRRVAGELGSPALKGDGALSGIGAIVGLVALTGLLLDVAFEWWWADRVAALVVAGIAAIEAARALRARPVAVPRTSRPTPAAGPPGRPRCRRSE